MIVLFLLVVLIAFLILAEKLFEQTNYYKNKEDETEKFKGEDECVSLVNTGSTFAFYGIDYGLCGTKGLNLAMKPQPLEKDFLMLKHFENRYEKGATIFIVISDLAFAKVAYAEKDTNNKYYKVLGKKEIANYSLSAASQEKYLPVTKNWKNFLRRFHDVKRINDYKVNVNENDYEAVEADAYKRCSAWEKEFGLTNLRDARQADRFKEEFAYTTTIVSQMIDWCLEKGFYPVLVNLPVTTQMENFFSEEFLDAFYYNNIKKANIKDVPFIDLTNTARLNDWFLYLDSCRLNGAGRKIITTHLLRQLETLRNDKE